MLRLYTQYTALEFASCLHVSDWNWKWRCNVLATIMVQTVRPTVKGIVRTDNAPLTFTVRIAPFTAPNHSCPTTTSATLSLVAKSVKKVSQPGVDPGFYLQGKGVMTSFELQSKPTLPIKYMNANRSESNEKERTRDTLSRGPTFWPRERS